MKTVYAFFAARRYWTDKEELTGAFLTITRLISGENCQNCFLIEDEKEIGQLPEADCLAIVPMSGAVQRLILKAAGRFPCIVLWAAYIRSKHLPEAVTNKMLRHNAAPTFMDCWAVLNRTHPRTRPALCVEELKDVLQVYEAYQHVKNSRLLMIGDTEPWVISNSKNLATYEERFGLTIECIPQEEVASRYHSTTDAAASFYYDYFLQHAHACQEPTDHDIREAAKMAAALTDTINAHNAQGCALACFNLLAEGTNLCLGVSYLNDCTDKIASCEGDMDSAVTMLLMKKLTDSGLWMANPGLNPDKTINFSHCTAPIHACGSTLPVILRSHHESGIGVSLQVDLPLHQTITACRISDEASAITIHTGESIEGAYECACRTQMHVKLKDPDHYLHTALGCHQVFAFEDISRKMEHLAELFSLEIL